MSEFPSIILMIAIGTKILLIGGRSSETRHWRLTSSIDNWLQAVQDQDTLFPKIER